MKNLFLFLMLLSCSSTADAQSSSEYFMENKGQITDDKGQRKENIDYILRGGEGETILIGAGRLEYHFSTKGQTECIVMDLQQTGKPQLIAESKSDYFENYYTSGNLVLRAGNAQRVCLSDYFFVANRSTWLNNCSSATRSDDLE